MMKAVVFDMDGVLFDSERLCMNSWVVEAEALGLSEMKELYPEPDEEMRRLSQVIKKI